jgi:hypothetical protein
MSRRKQKSEAYVRDQILWQTLVIASPDLSGRGNLKTINARDCFGRFAPSTEIGHTQACEKVPLLSLKG